MALAEAAKNILDSYRFQLQLRGDLLPRLHYTSLWWARYLISKYRHPSVKDNWVDAYLSSLKSLARSGHSQRLVQVGLPNGSLLEIDLFTCQLVVKEIYFDRMYESAECSPREGWVVFDVGGQQGVYAILAADKVGKGGRVISVEPEPRNFGQLKKNINLNNLLNVIAVQGALLDKAGSAELCLSDWNMGGHTLRSSDGIQDAATKIQIQTRTLDALSAEMKAAPDLIKIDVEGSSIAVLRGGLNTIRERKPAIVLELDSPGDSALVNEMLVPLGYTVRVSGNILFAFIRQAP